MCVCVCVQEMVERWAERAAGIRSERLSDKDKRELRILKSYLQTFLDGYKWRESVLCSLAHGRLFMVDCLTDRLTDQFD